jgi:hypothetical protein
VMSVSVRCTSYIHTGDVIVQVCSRTGDVSRTGYTGSTTVCKLEGFFQIFVESCNFVERTGFVLRNSQSENFTEQKFCVSCVWMISL